MASISHGVPLADGFLAGYARSDAIPARCACDMVHAVDCADVGARYDAAALAGGFGGGRWLGWVVHFCTSFRRPITHPIISASRMSAGIPDGMFFAIQASTNSDAMVSIDTCFVWLLIIFVSGVWWWSCRHCPARMSD